jgi:hypothetical protein
MSKFFLGRWHHTFYLHLCYTSRSAGGGAAAAEAAASGGYNDML